MSTDEYGTQGASATVIELGFTSTGDPIPTYKFNRPFVFVIEETTSGAILFTGAVTNL